MAVKKPRMTGTKPAGRIKGAFSPKGKSTGVRSFGGRRSIKTPKE